MRIGAMVAWWARGGVLAGWWSLALVPAVLFALGAWFPAVVFLGIIVIYAGVFLLLPDPEAASGG